MAIGTVGVRLDEQTIRRLKVTAAERGVTLSALFEEALAVWWAKQPEAKTHGPLRQKDQPELTIEKGPAEKSQSKKSEKV